MATAQDILQWLIWMSSFALTAVAIATGVHPVLHLKDLQFTQSAYNATIPENALGKTFITPSTKMGMYLPLDDPPKVTYHILGKQEDLFKAESYVLGDFCFLIVRTNSASYGKVNRELQSLYQLKIQATAKDKTGLVYQISADLNVFVSDLNDLSPIFDHKSYEATVREDTPLHGSIVKVSAYDGDEGINAEIYYSFVQKTNTFAIHPTTGIVTLTRPLNFVLQDTYSLEVMAEDRGPKQAHDSSKIRSTKLIIQVEQVNYFNPEISINHLSTLEEKEAGTVAAIVSVIDRDMGLNGKVDSLQISGGNKEGLFSVVPGNQEDESLIVLNRTLSRKRLYGSFNLTLTVSDMGRPPRNSNATLFMDVLDFFHNGPIFTKDIYNISVEEIVPSGTPLLHLGPTSSIFNRLRHTLRITNGDEGGLFDIRNNGLLLTASKLDADEFDFFYLEISAFDGQLDEKHKIASTSVKIYVLDCNDNSPIFTNLKTDSSISVRENVPIGYQVFHVTASDTDKGENGLISYSFTNSDSLPFEIDPFTGIIKTKQLLDYETSRHHYLVKVRASDWGAPFAQEVESFVTVNLLDENDNTPKFEKINCTGFLSRDAPVNTELLVTSAIDFDRSNLISYKIVSGNADGCFALDPTTAKLVLKCPLKNDPNDVKRVQIIATDGEHDSDPVMIEVTLLNVKRSTQLANGNVSIKCQDTDVALQLREQMTMSRKNNIEQPVTISGNHDNLKNLHPPKFLENSPVSVEVSEKASVGSLVLTMSATDEDSGYNGVLVYVIKEGDPGGRFKIDTRTGQIVVAAELDRELTATYELVIEVSDLGSPALSANATLSVTVQDENDNAPVFERNKYEATISENIVVNATVTQVHASDMDIGKNAEIVYSIVSDTNNFYIYPLSGIIVVNKVLDREFRQVYNVLVRASDKGEISLSSTATVAITLTDVNDNVPKFLPEIYSVRIREDLPIGAVVNTVTAEDLDLGSNGEVSYKLVYGDDYFEIDDETGTIRIAQRLDYETRQVHNISVRAQDGGNPPLTSTCFINVEIVDVNENLYPPEFDNFFAQGYVNENEPVGTTVMFIHARDPDGSEEDGQITYSLRDGSGLGRFTIDQNGTIRTNQVLDRESVTHYWLTVYAQDHGLVPLHSRLEVLIEIRDVNDNIPTPEQPIYYASVKEEDKTEGIVVAEVKAYDNDKNLGQMLTFDITKWNDDGFFQINKETGVITTTGIPLDREKKDVHSLEVTVCDNGEPNLCNIARVIIKVEDINDNKPQFSEQKKRVQIPEAVWHDRDIPVFTVLASDADDGDNGRIRFGLRGNHSVFEIDKKTGIISATSDLVKGTVHNLMVRAVDQGEPNTRKSTAQVIVEVVERLKSSHNAPKFISPSLTVDVLEGDKVGHMLDIVQAEDPDGDKLWYSITDGDSLGQFAIGPEAGNLILADRLDWEMTSLYNLTLQVTDGVYTNTCNVVVRVININDNWPLFRNNSYVAFVLESAPIGTSIIQVEATDADMDNRLLYTFPDYANTKASLALFRINPNTGDIFVKSALDREVLAEHNLTVMVQDQGTTSNRNYTRVTISVLDDNDHPPEFLSSIFNGRIFETAAIGTSVVEVSAMDRDKGDNSQLSYSILSGNIGGVFAMESTLGVISVAKELDRNSKAEYELVVMAADKGQVPLSSTATVRISITVSNNAPPKFTSLEYMAEVPENQPIFTNIISVSAECQSSVVYSIMHGNKENHFAINPNSGVVHSSVVIDYEKVQFYNLTISATNIIHATTYTTLLIHVVDENDNAPNFSQSLYVGNISETAKPGTVVLTANKTALVVQALDMDSGQNALLKYEIRDEHAKKFVTIDPSTGAIRTVGELDHEVFQKLEFTVEVCDMGRPQLRGLNPAKVVIYVNDVNDTPPKFSKSEYSAIVLLPTYQDVVITQVSATDPDSGIDTILKYSIKSGNEDGKFCIKQDTGEVFVFSEIGAISDYHLVLEVMDGLFKSQTILNISVQQSIDSGITFSKYIYKASAKENDPEVRTLDVIQVSGRALNQQYTFRLLNGQDKFVIGRTSGVLKTSGKPLDREQLSLYRLVVEVTGETGKAHAIVEVIVEDENDNAPMFVNQPYHAVALKDLHLGGTVKQVTAIDKDAGRNAYVSYKLTERGDIDNKFAMDSATGKILLSRALVESDVGREVTLSIEASDGGEPKYTVQTMVAVKIINKYYPLFEKQVYKAEIQENSPAGTVVIGVEAISSTNQKLIYSIVHGDPYRDFWMDFSIGMITVKGQLDFEMTPSYNLTIEAMETLSGLSATAIVLIQVKDVNDNKPTFDSLKYVGIVSEAATIGTIVSKVTAKDRDTGINGEVQYSLVSEMFGDKDINYFSINSETGEITTNLFLDYDERSEFNFLVVSMDKGVPSLTSSVPVQVTVADLNDNAPMFDLPLYQCVISDLATRGQLVTKVSAQDLDTSSSGYLHYSIVSGNDKQTFHIDSENGIIYLSEYRKPQLYSVYDLNVSVSDGVFTSYAKVGISIRNSNNYAPVFDQSIYVAEFPENYGVGMLVTSVSAIDKDAGTYGMLTYTIPSETLNAIFRVDADSGEIFSRQVLDREEQSFYEIPVAATDNGGRMSFTRIHITITDLNDNAPMFLAQSYKSNIFPNTTINSTILQVTAIDQDSGVNGAVQYLLSNPPGSKAAKYFSINPHTGIITLTQTVEDFENEVFQFFVRAVDMGEPYSESNVNVEILVMFKDDRPPSFSQDIFSYFILESDPVGTVIATVTAESQDSVEYLIIPGQTKSSNTPPMFAVDGKGRIQVANYLNHETTSSFVLTVRAQTLTVPPLIRETRVIVNLMDVNDNSPVFESASYSVTVAEQAEIGTELIQVKAHDKDKATRLKYSFGHDIEEHSHLFGLDSATGMLTLLSPLDRETKSQYNITIFVLDTDDAKSFKNSTIVYISVTDHNDNPPVFTRKKYQAAVNEDAYTGTIIMSMSTEDKDIGVNKDVTYFIIDGDKQGRFQIQKNGEIFVNRELDRETTAGYSLVVAATDGAFVSTATVVVDILDANDNSPVCGQAIHEKIVPEDASLSYILHWMQATDADEFGTRNSQIQYQLIAEGSDLFSLDPTSGILKSRAGLDREKQSYYKLIGSAMDGGGKSCTTVIYISISDINDNPPEFDTPSAIVMVKEDVSVNSLIYRVSAHDQDLGINGQILFHLKADGNGTFRIDPRSGLIQLSKALDRETQSHYTLSIQATDQGTPHLTSEAILAVKVLDVNDNPPEFERTSYTASVVEDAPVGKSVLMVRATSLDTGINAQITYSIVAGNDKKKFTIDKDSGVIQTNDVLDHEELSSFMLTIQAMDHGEEPLSNTVIVQINVTDVNDNPPVFTQSAYTAKVREDVKIGTKFLQLVATDADSTKKNSLITFSIESGDHLSNFVIGKENGALLVNTPLDREAIPTYVLHVRATNEHFMTNTTVNVEVLDANDCPPRFSQYNYTVYVQEDRDIGVSILQFTVNDDDLDPNGPPFTFDIVKGNAGGEFRVDSEGILRTASKLNRRLTTTYQLTVRVFDNGAPALYSDMDVTVFVTEESTFAPEVNNLEVSISSYLDDFPGGVIGQIKAVDADVHDTLTYEVVSPNRRLFDIDKKDGRIIAFAGLDSGQYLVNISVSDGKYTTYGKVDVDVSTVTEDMITNAVTIQFADISPDSFVRNYKKDFQRVLKRELNVRARDVEIISIQKSDSTSETGNRARRSAGSYLDVLFAVKRNPDSYMKQIGLRKKVQQAIGSIQDTLNVRVVKVFSDICEPGLCDGGGQCVGYVEFDKDSLVPIFMEGGSFVSAKHRYTYDCECPDGSVGETCLKNLTSCSQNPCPKYKICLPLSDNKFRCDCPLGKTGKRCEKETDKCTSASCQKGDKPMTFSGQSYARWTLQESIESRLSLQLSMKTRKETANLMYVKGDKDYSILELVHGRIQYRFDCGSGEGLVIVPYIVSDGEWHTIIVERHGKQAEIFLDGKYSAITTAPGSNKNLNLNTKHVYFGAEVDVYQNGYHDIRKGFEGCMENIRIYNIRLPVSGSNAAALEQEFARIDFQCKDDEYPFLGNSVCSSFPCMNNGKCENAGLHSYICKCLDRYRGAKCEIDTDPCQESPCFNNGICTNIQGIPNEYHCTCPKDHIGRRCEYGQFCIPNPCIHGGTCIEGPSSYICMCRPGYGGTRCEQMVTTCRDNPCQNGGICQATIEGLYYCNCTEGHRGHHCEDIRAPVITSNAAGINPSEIYVIVGVIGGILFVVLIFVLVRYVRIRRREKRRRRNVNAGATNTETEGFLNSLKSDSNGFGSDKFIAKKPNRKNPPSPQPPPVPDRPASYTPSTHDSLNTLNNFDSVRNYGSAAEELENCHNNIPYNLDFLQTFSAPPPRSVASIAPSLPPPPPSNSASDSDSVQKAPWILDCQNILKHYADKHADKLAKSMPVGTVAPMSRYQGQGQDTTSFSSLTISDTEDDLLENKRRKRKGYHWDTSDWAPQKSLPNISEVPPQECPDSPGSASPQSNDSNTHVFSGNRRSASNIPEYIDSEYVGDSEYAENEYEMEEIPCLPNYEELLAQQHQFHNDYQLPHHNFNIHPNHYLPAYNIHDQSAESENWPGPPSYDQTADSEQSAEDDNDSVIHYGFPQRRNMENRLSVLTADSDFTGQNRLSAAYTTDSEWNGENYRTSMIESTDNMSVSVEGLTSANDSVSDISGLCEIEDSEINVSDDDVGDEPDETNALMTKLHTEV